MKISYSILTHNETDSLLELIHFLMEHKDEEDEIVILDDYSDNEKTREILDSSVSIYEIKFEQRHLLKDYAGQKNHLTRMCKGDYIINILVLIFLLKHPAKLVCPEINSYVPFINFKATGISMLPFL